MSATYNYYIDMEQRFNDYKNNKIDMRNLSHLVYEPNNVALAVKRLSESKGKNAKGIDGTNYKTLENYSINELSEVVKDRLINKKMDYVRRIYIPKKNKKEKRPLGICTIFDKLVEKCIQLVLEPYCETKFVDSSFGFRPKVGTHNAIAKAKNQCQTMPFVLSIDMKDYFGTIDPDIAYRELWHIGIKDQIILNYIYHFIKKGHYEDMKKVENKFGVAQGGCLSPLISNIYLHRFDVWVKDQGDCWHDKTVEKFHNNEKRKNMRKTNLKVGIHLRFADDIYILCHKEEDAYKFKYSIINYLTRNLKLTINEQKTKIINLTTGRIRILGYDFYAHKKNKRGRHLITNELPKEREDEIVSTCKRKLYKIRNQPTLENFHKWNTYVLGIHNYYRGMNKFHNNFARIGWRIRKSFKRTMNQKAKFTKENIYKNNYIDGRYKTWGNEGYYCYCNYPIIQIEWANWNKNLVGFHKGKINKQNPYSVDYEKSKPGVSKEDLTYLVEHAHNIKNVTYARFRISKYSSVKGRSYISGEYVPVNQYHCHHIKPLHKGGNNSFVNLCVLSEMEHKILHSKTPERLYEIYPKKKKRIKELITALS